MKRPLGRVAVVAATTLLALLAAELVVRGFFKDDIVLFPRYHADYRYGPYTLRGIRPNARFWHTSVEGSWEFVTNSKGLRDRRELAYEKPVGTLRVLALGDSHTQGYEVRQEATYSAVVERFLASRGVKAEVLNSGVSGFSTAEALAYLENEGRRYEPDVVVLGFYANDFEDNLKAGLFRLEEGRLIARKYEHIPGVSTQNLIYSIPGTQWLGENSYFYSLLFNQVWAFMKQALHERAVREALAHANNVEEGELEFAIATRDEHPPYAVALAVALIERMQRFCSERGIRLVLVDIPQPGGPYRLRSSLPEATVKQLHEAQIELIHSRTLLGEVDGAAELHRTRGHRHISEFTHTLIGVELGRRILQR
jgi:lysophospholipase L1-like esterase